MEITLENIQAKIKETEIELAELKSAYKVMSKLAGITTLSSSSKEDTKLNNPSISETGTINLDELELPVKVMKTTDSLQSNIRKLIKRFDEQEFTVNHVEAALKGIGKGSNAKHFRNRVSVIIKRLVEEGVIKREFEGKGNVAHRYVNAQTNKSSRSRSWRSE